MDDVFVYVNPTPNVSVTVSPLAVDVTAQGGGFVNTAQYITTGQTGAFYPVTNPSGFITGVSGYVASGQTGLFATTGNLNATGITLQSEINALNSVTGNFITTGQTGNFATSTNLAATGNTLQTEIGALNTWTGNSTGLYYPLHANPSGYITGINSGAFQITGATVKTNLIQGIANSNLINVGAAQLYDASASLNLDWSRKLLYNGGINTVDWGNSKLMSSTTQYSVDWLNFKLNNGEADTVDWGGLTLNAAGHSIVDWGNQNLNDFDGSLSVDWNNKQLNNGNYTTVDWLNSMLNSQYGQTVAWNYNECYLMAQPWGSIVLNWFNQQMFDLGGATSIDWSNRILTDTSTNTSVDWANRQLQRNIIIGGVPTEQVILDWNSGILYQNWNVSGSLSLSGSPVLNAASTGVLTGVFYPFHSNPSGYLTGVNTGNFITTGQTGVFALASNLNTTGVTLQTEISALNTWTGNSTGLYYPLTNPSGFGGGVKQISVTGINVSGNIIFTGVGGATVTLSGQTISISGVPTGSFVTTGQTGAFTGTFYPRNSNPAGYLTSAVTQITAGGGSVQGNVTFSAGTGISISNNGATFTITDATENKRINAFLDVSIGAGNGGDMNFYIQNFSTIPYSSVNSDVGGNWNSTDFFYTVPYDGIYQIITKLRVTDAWNSGESCGQGADIVGNGDSPTFLWFVTNPNRNGSFNMRVSHFLAGQEIQGIGFADDGNTPCSDASMQITLLDPDD